MHDVKMIELSYAIKGVLSLIIKLDLRELPPSIMVTRKPMVYKSLGMETNSVRGRYITPSAPYLR